MAKRMIKYCPGCETHMPIIAFGLNRSMGDGLQGWCLDCSSVYAAKRRKANKEKWAGKDPHAGSE